MHIWEQMGPSSGSGVEHSSMSERECVLFSQGPVLQYTSTGGRHVIYTLPTYCLVVSSEAQVLVVVWVAFI